MLLNKKNLVILASALVLGGGAWLLAGQGEPTAAVPESPVQLVATTTPRLSVPTTTVATKKKPLPPEPIFTLPTGAVAIDSYAYTQDGKVYFRPLTSVNPLPIPDADADSFERISEFMTYPGTAVLDECGATPQYAYYRDRKQVYFYHNWRATAFRGSHIDIISGARAKDFTVTGPLSAEAGVYQFKLGYTKATTTCRLNLTQVSP